MEENALHFNNCPALYDDARPGYPPEIYAVVAKYAHFDANSRILEIGAGNGIASREIYRAWQPKMVLLEPGEALLELLRGRFKDDNDITIVNKTFEEYECDLPFDAIISATAFHWLDLSTKYKKSCRLLKDNGLLILYWNNYGIEAEEIAEEIQKVYRKHGLGIPDGKSAHERQMEKIESRKKEIEESGFFTVIEHRIIKSILEYPTEKYIRLLKTFPDHSKMGAGFFEEIAEIIKSNGDNIGVRVLVNLEIAGKNGEIVFPENSL